MIKQLFAFKNAYMYKEDGVTAIEYALIAAAVAAVLVGAGTIFEEDLAAVFSSIGGDLEDAAD